MISKEEANTTTAKVFNAASDYFDAPALSFWSRFGQQTIDRLSLHSGHRVLDVCCGTGASAIPAAVCVGSTGQVLGVDLAESLLELGRQKSRQQGLKNIEFRHGDFEHLGLPRESFDAIVCVFGIFFVPDMVAAVRELWRMVRPGGKLAITSWGAKVFEPANQRFWEILETERPDLVKKLTPWDRIRDRASLQALLESGGATQVKVFAESSIHELAAPEDWWTMVLGGGLRGTIDQLDPAARERVRQANLQFLLTNQVQSLEVDVLYAIAQKSHPRQR
ncbi:ubiquinone biosynthesis protein UbiE [Neosynechococcus sphagnicola sy1]|uniref:Ubiquinone biosynthesis protein UbiE n=1 Tax=Neosynechococcus sphagnicola sy1 TaxID=1497020 RepID=A0A098TP07_9CYAN|nr:class I SAM-dependent methyltransferase [Neosynechococcus sphagnicola]KGF74011.1 ubiquinone biosynthesis protein UbiE [Neosynechococcus sphagnicola sy1]